MIVSLGNQTRIVRTNQNNIFLSIHFSSGVIHLLIFLLHYKIYTFFIDIILICMSNITSHVYFKGALCDFLVISYFGNLKLHLKIQACFALTNVNISTSKSHVSSCYFLCQ